MGPLAATPNAEEKLRAAGGRGRLFFIETYAADFFIASAERPVAAIVQIVAADG